MLEDIYLMEEISHKVVVERISEITVVPAAVKSIAVSKNKLGFIAVGRADNTIDILDAKTFAQLSRLSGNSSQSLNRN